MIARQLWHCTLRRSSVARSRSAAAEAWRPVSSARSATLPVARSIAYGDSVPQNGQTSFSVAGFHSACAPPAGQACFPTS